MRPKDQFWLATSALRNRWVIVPRIHHQNFNLKVLQNNFSEDSKILNFQYFSPICTKLIGYHSVTVCWSYGQPKIRQRPTFVKPAVGGLQAYGSRMVAERFCADREIKFIFLTGRFLKSIYDVILPSFTSFTHSFWTFTKTIWIHGRHYVYSSVVQEPFNVRIRMIIRHKILN
jgi:hypothetical protein